MDRDYYYIEIHPEPVFNFKMLSVKSHLMHDLGA